MRVPQAIHQNIGRLQIAVQDASLMRVIDGVSHVGDEPGRIARPGREVGQVLV